MREMGAEKTKQKNFGKSVDIEKKMCYHTPRAEQNGADIWMREWWNW